MTEFTPEAKTLYEEYLQRVRTCLGLSPSADADDVVQDVREHVDKEFQDRPSPAAAEDLKAVLDRLGSPDQWIAEDIPWWRRAAEHVRKGPEDWRLAYLSLGVLIFGTALTGSLGVLGSFCLSRAALAVSPPREIEAKRWLIYPSLVIVYGLLGGIVLFWPVFPLCGTIELFGPNRLIVGHRLFYRDGPGSVLATCCAVALGLTAWWMLLRRVAQWRPQWVEAVFRPFGQSPLWHRFWTRASTGMAVAGMVLAGVTITLWFAFGS